MDEVWNPILGYDEKYWISSIGRVRSHLGKSQVADGRILKSGTSGTGYFHVQLYNNGKPSSHYIHHLVAAAFLGDRPDGFDINHKDGDKRNNVVRNLEYLTRAGNAEHAYRTGLKSAESCSSKGSKNGRAALVESDIPIIRELAETMIHEKIAERFGVSKATVQRIVAGTSWKHVA